jgi:hypothetical protein
MNCLCSTLHLSTTCSAPFSRAYGRRITTVYSGRGSRHCYAIMWIYAPAALDSPRSQFDPLPMVISVDSGVPATIIPVTGQRIYNCGGPVPRYDLFRIDKGSPLWVGATETLHEANAQAKRLADCPGCVVLDRTTGHKIVLMAGQAADRTTTPSAFRHS